MNDERLKRIVRLMQIRDRLTVFMWVNGIIAVACGIGLCILNWKRIFK
jgi:hypothetical protein